MKIKTPQNKLQLPVFRINSALQEKNITQREKPTTKQIIIYV
jgi:hypothetical protein